MMSLLLNITVKSFYREKDNKNKATFRWLYPTLEEGNLNCLSHQLTTGFSRLFCFPTIYSVRTHRQLEWRNLNKGDISHKDIWCDYIVNL